MSGKKGLAVGLIIGFVIACIGVTTTIIVYDNQIQTKQAEAFDKGFEEGASTDVSADISEKFNTGLMDENKALADQLDGARNKLEALQSRDDLTPQAKDQINLILESLK